MSEQRVTAHEALNEKIRDGLADRDSQRGRNVALQVICPKHIAKVRDYPALSRRLREIKAYSITNLDALVKRAVAAMQAVNCKVFYARTGAEARDYILGVIRKGPVVKSKTNAGKEIGLVDALEAAGIQVIETDLGDRIVQLAGSHPSHSLVPALHIPLERIAQIFSEETGQVVDPTLDACIAAARKGLLHYMLDAQYGISGANAIAADSGTIFLIENEGNVRAVTNLPHTHIVIAGIEKIVPTPQDALTVVQAASVYGLGQDLGTYVSCISGPSRTGDIEYKVALGMHGPKEVHVVLLDNGRSEAIRQGYEEALYCTNCGSCLNFCPVYGAIGERYGYKYLGGRGIAFTAFHAGLDTAVAEGLPLCTTCESCKATCPAQIDAPKLVKRLRKDAGCSALEFEPYAQAKAEIDRNGNPYGETRKPWGHEKSSAENVVFVGCVGSFRERESAEATLRLLERLGVDFTTIDERCCGGVYEDIGYQANAEFARHNLDAVRAAGAKRVIAICPRCMRFLKESPGYEGVEIVHVTEFLAEFLAGKGLPVKTGAKIAYHDPCHLGRSQGVYQAPRDLVRMVADNTVEPLRSKEYGRCCGAGSVVRGVFPRLSISMARTRVQEFEDTGADVVLTECFACLHNLRNALTSRNKVEVYNITEYISLLLDGKAQAAAE
ncbi:MAG: LUD domain-containing protein [Firmicutes bacterium]|nr:LUD domain-containing protein [Bacillota bacterium]